MPQKPRQKSLTADQALQNKNGRGRMAKKGKETGLESQTQSSFSTQILKKAKQN